MYRNACQFVGPRDFPCDDIGGEGEQHMVVVGFGQTAALSRDRQTLHLRGFRSEDRALSTPAHCLATAWNRLAWAPIDAGLVVILEDMHDNGGPLECRLPLDFRVSSLSLTEHTAWLLAESGQVFEVNGVPSHPAANLLPFPVRVAEVSCGRLHTVFRSETGQVFAMGRGAHGQLGLGHVLESSAPLLVDALDGLVCTQISAGGWHTLFLTDAGDAYSCGRNDHGQLGRIVTGDDATPASVPGLMMPAPGIFDMDLTCVEVSAGSSHSLTLLSTGDVFAWGLHEDPALIHGHGQRPDTAQPKRLATIVCDAQLPPRRRLISGPCAWHSFILIK